MVTVKLFGTLRTDSGIKMLEVEASSIKELYVPLYNEIVRISPDPGFSLKDLKSCLIAVNGARVSKNTKLHDGDEISILSSAGGG